MKKNIVICTIIGIMAIVFGMFVGQICNKKLENYVTSEIEGALTTEVKQTLENEGYRTSDGVKYERTDTYTQGDVRYESKSYFNVDTMTYHNVVEIYDDCTGDRIGYYVDRNTFGASEGLDTIH